MKAYLAGQGVGLVRLTSLGKGESDPVGDNSLWRDGSRTVASK